MDRRLFAKNVALMLGGVALDQLEILDRLNWKRTLFPSPMPRPYARLFSLRDGSVKNLPLLETLGSTDLAGKITVSGMTQEYRVDVRIPREIVFDAMRRQGYPGVAEEFAKRPDYDGLTLKCNNGDPVYVTDGNSLTVLYPKDIIKFHHD